MSNFKQNIQEWIQDLKKKPYTDDAYMETISKYKDKSYYDRLLENPWLYSKQADFSPTLLQQIGETFGDTSARDNYYAGILQNQNTWLSDTIKQYEKQDYDSAQEQTKRQAAAGINPDLAMSATPGEGASPSPESLPGVPMSPSESITPIISSFSHVFTDVLGGALNVVSSLSSVNSLILDNSLKSLSLSRGLSDEVYSIISESTNDYFTGLESPADFNIESAKDLHSLYETVLGNISSRIDRLPYSSRIKKKMRSIVDSQLLESKMPKSDGGFGLSTKFQRTILDELSKFAESKSNYAKSISVPGSRSDNLDALEVISTEIYQPIQELQLEVQNMLLTKNAQYLRYFNKNSGGEAEAKSHITQYNLQSDLNNVKRKVTTAFEAINKKITGSNRLSEPWKLGLQAALATAESKLLVSMAQPFSMNFSQKEGFSFGM